MGSLKVDTTVLDELEDVRAGLADARAIPPRWYRDEDVLEAERRAVFRRNWIYAGPAEWVQNSGDFFTTELGGVPVVVTRGDDGELRGFVNICRHRGHHLAQGRGCRQVLQCQYHAWTWDLQGGLRNAPRAPRELDVPIEELSLWPISVHVWGPLVFATLVPSQDPPQDELNDLTSVLGDGGLDLSVLGHRRHSEWELKANWKVGVENYIECYHCPTVHRSLRRFVDLTPEISQQEIRGRLMMIYSPVKDEALKAGALPYNAAGEVVRNDAHLLWPATTLSMFPGRPNLIVSTWQPNGSGATTRVSDAFFGSDVTEQEIDEMLGYFTEVGDEDIPIAESTHHGLVSGGMTEPGYLMLPSEGLIQGFQYRLVDALDEWGRSRPGVNGAVEGQC